jgi:hypothetical protein
MRCKFCGKETNLIDAHIIPKGFFRRLQVSKKSLEMVSNKLGEFTRRVPIGVYDKHLVCIDCEKIWGEWDDYAQKILGEEPKDSRVIWNNGKKICYVIDKYDYKKLKLFFISLAWRASVSEQPYFSKISLGQFDPIAKEFIRNNDPRDSETFGVILAKFDHPLARSILDPHSSKIDGVNFLRFYLSGYIAYIKVDKKPFPTLYSKCAMAESKPLYIICRDFKKSKELDLMITLVKQNQILLA